MRPKVDENGWLVPLHQDSKAYLVYCLLKQGTTPRLYSQMVWRITHPDKAHRHKYTPRPKQPRALRPITNTILDLWVDGLSMKAIMRELNLRWTQVDQAIRRGRRRQDPRAIYHYDGSNPRSANMKDYYRIKKDRPPLIPAGVLIEREKMRMAEHASYTAAHCGDPLPGRSALDQLKAKDAR